MKMFIRSKISIGLFVLISIYFTKSHQASLASLKDNETTTFKKLEIFFLEECECIELSNCQRMTDIIAKVKLPISSSISDRIRKTSCGFKNKLPLVCCPYEEQIFTPNSAELVNFRFGSTADSNNNENSDWTWPKEDSEYINSYHNNINYDYDDYDNSKYVKENIYGIKNKFSFYDSNTKFNNKELIMKNLIDFEDEKTHKNCPPSFYDVNSFNENYKYVGKNENNYNKFYQHGGNRHHYPHNHHHYPSYNTPNWYNNDQRHRHRFNPNDFSSNFYPKIEPTNKPIIPEQTNPTPTTAPSNTNNNGNNNINSQQCGISISTRTIGGTATLPGQFPWMARIAYRNLTSAIISYRCGGSFINSLYMVTAAHCITNLIDNLEVSHVRLGDDLSEISSQLELQINQLIPHPQYDSPKYANDVGLIRISQQSSSIQITPVCLPVGEYSTVDNNIVGKMGVVAGWLSNTRGAPRSNELEMNWVRLPIVNRTNCAKIYADFSVNSRAPIIVTNSQICAQGTENMDACQGDSGGPLMLENPDNNNPKSVLLGLVSFGPRTCGISNFPGVYTRISAYIDWIIRNI